MNVITLLTPKAQVAYLMEDCTVRQGVEKMRNRGYTALPVLARDGRYICTVSEGDFLWYLAGRKNSNLQSQEHTPLDRVLRRGFNPAVSVRVTMEELLDRAIQQSFVPVVDDRGVFMGIVTRQTIIRRLAIPNTDTAAGHSSTAVG